MRLEGERLYITIGRKGRGGRERVEGEGGTRGVGGGEGMRVPIKVLREDRGIPSLTDLHTIIFLGAYQAPYFYY